MVRPEAKQIAEEGKKNNNARTQARAKLDQQQADWKELSEEAGRAKIAADVAMAAQPAQPEVDTPDIEAILGKVASLGLEPKDMQVLQAKLQAPTPLLLPAQADQPAGAQEERTLYDDAFAGRMPSLPQQLAQAAADVTSELPAAEETPVDPRFDHYDETLPEHGAAEDSEDEEDDMRDSAAKRKAGEHWQQEQGAVVHVEEDAREAAPKKTKAAQTSAQEIVERMAAIAQKELGCQERCSSSTTAAANKDGEKGPGEPPKQPAEPTAAAAAQAAPLR